MSAAIANSFIFRESYFAEEVLQFQHPTRIDEDEDNNTYGLDYIRKYVEQLTADSKLQLQSPSAMSTLHAGSATLLSSSPSSSSSSSSSATTTTSSAAAAHAAIIAFDFASIQVSPPPSSSSSSSSSSSAPTSANNTNTNDSSSPSSLTHHEDGANRLENELDLPRYLSWFDEDALASDCDEDDDVAQFYDDDEADDSEEADDESAVEVDDVPLFIGQQAQLQIFEVTKKYKQSLTPDISLSTSPSSSSFSLLAQNDALPVESSHCDTVKRKSRDSDSESKKNPTKRVKRWTQ